MDTENLAQFVEIGRANQNPHRATSFEFEIVRLWNDVACFEAVVLHQEGQCGRRRSDYRRSAMLTLSA